MHTLYPPLDDETAPMNNASNDVLPAELKQSFDSIRAMVNGTNEESSKPPSRKRKNSADADEFESKKLQMAIKTAVAVENEISRLRNGIAELESLLAQQEGGEVVAFPSLPPVVPSDESFVEGTDDAKEEEADCESLTKKSGEIVHG